MADSTEKTLQFSLADESHPGSSKRSLMIMALLLGGLVGVAIFSSNNPKDDSTTTPAVPEAE